MNRRGAERRVNAFDVRETCALTLVGAGASTPRLIVALQSWLRENAPENPHWLLLDGL